VHELPARGEAAERPVRMQAEGSRLERELVAVRGRSLSFEQGSDSGPLRVPSGYILEPRQEPMPAQAAVHRWPNPQKRQVCMPPRHQVERLTEEVRGGQEVYPRTHTGRQQVRLPSGHRVE